MSQISPSVAATLNRQVPRYTSYPTAPHFHAGIDAETYATWLGEIPAGASASLYLHVPFCSEMCWYCGCNTAVVRRYKPIGDYAGLLCREIDLVADRIGRRQPVRHMQWGGGTPSLLSADDLDLLFETLRARFDVANDAEIGFEIDPRTLTREAVDALVACGVNRASLGVQDFDARVQQAVNRIQPYEMTAQAVEWLRTAGIQGINFDLMYGLPYQTTWGALATAEQALSLRPDRIALFGYAHVPWMKPHQKLIPEEALPDVAERHRQQNAVADRLRAAGYVQIGLDHFARADDPMAAALAEGDLHRNFQGYTTDDADVLIGLGASAIGTLPAGYVQNAASVPEYRAAIREEHLATARGIEIEPVDRMIAEVIESLMCNLAVDLDTVCSHHAIDATALAAGLTGVDELAAQGVVTREGHCITMTEVGRPFVRLVCAAFDRHLATGKGRHAAAV